MKCTTYMIRAYADLKTNYQVYTTTTTPEYSGVYIMAKILSLISGIFSDFPSPEISAIYHGTENHPHFGCY